MSLATKVFRKHWYLTSRNVTYAANGTQTNSLDYLRHVTALDGRTADETKRDWRALIRRGGSATTQLSGTLHVLKPGYGDAYQKVKNNGSYEFDHGCLLASAVVFGTSVGDINVTADNIARSKLLSHYIGIRNNWRGGNFLAELRETIHALKHPLDTAYSNTLKWVQKVVANKRKLAYMAERQRHNAKSIKDLRKAMADDWLTYAFGLKPLISDIQDGSDAFNKMLDPERSDRISISGKGNIVGGSTSRLVGSTVPGSIPITYEQTTVTNSSVKYYGQLKARPYGRGLQLEKFGVDPYDAIPAVWEAIPFSWFVDYFVNVSEVLDGCRLWSADVAWLNRGVRNSSAITQHSLKCVKSDATYTDREVGGKGAFTLVLNVDRRPSSLPHPNWTFKMPGLGSFRWLNIAAVIEQIKHQK